MAYDDESTNASRMAEAYKNNSPTYRKSKAEQAAAEEKARVDAVNGIPGSIFSGTKKEQAGQLAGLNTGTVGYGQGLAQTGHDIQRVKELQNQRLAQSGADPVSAAIMGQKATAVANAQRANANSGVKGGAGQGIVNSVSRAADQDIAASLYGQQAQALEDVRSLASNTLAGQTGLMYGEKAANVKAPAAPSNSGSSFICTVLRNKGLMTRKETYLMTQFMLKALFTRSNFLFWYFKNGKKAVDVADASGIDWAQLKPLFVDDILALYLNGKLEEAQDLYISRTGVLCTTFGAKGFDKKFEKLNRWNILKFPKLLTVKECREWLKYNYDKIPKILKYSIPS